MKAITLEKLAALSGGDAACRQARRAFKNEPVDSPDYSRLMMVYMDTCDVDIFE